MRKRENKGKDQKERKKKRKWKEEKSKRGKMGHFSKKRTVSMREERKCEQERERERK